MSPDSSQPLTDGKLEKQQYPKDMVVPQLPLRSSCTSLYAGHHKRLITDQGGVLLQ